MNKSEKKIPVPEFPEPKSMGLRDWGNEDLLVHSEGKYTMKQLFLKAGKKGGLQFHRKKDESSYVISGKLLLRFDDGNGNLKEMVVGPGDWFRFPPGCIHQEEAITDVLRIEVSTPHFNDRVRVEENYGIKVSGGLPTTSENEIVEG